MDVRRASAGDIAALVALSVRIQDALSAAGSLQEFGPLAEAVVATHVAAGTAYLLDDGAQVLGGVFLAPVTSHRHKAIACWGLDVAASPIWFLEKLMIEPVLQGRRLGDVLLGGVQQVAASHHAHPTTALDCWAGNDALHAFYTRNGFSLHGIFPEGGFEVAVFAWSAADV